MQSFNSSADFTSMLIPKKLFLTKGVGKHKDYLQSFELALRDAGIQHANIVEVSSIILQIVKSFQLKKEKNSSSLAR